MSTPPLSAPSRLDGDSRAVVVTVSWLIGLVALTGFVIGIPGLLTIAGWAGLTGPLSYGVPVVLDGEIAIMALAAVVQRARFESTRFTMGVVAVLTGLSVTAQVAHVLIPAWGQVTLQDIVGACFSALAPITVYTTTHVLLSLAIAPPSRRSGRRAGRSSGPQGTETGPAALTSGAVSAVHPKPGMDQAARPTAHDGAPTMVQIRTAQVDHREPANRLTPEEIEAQVQRTRELLARGLKQTAIAAELDLALGTAKHRIRAARALDAAEQDQSHDVERQSARKEAVVS